MRFLRSSVEVVFSLAVALCLVLYPLATNLREGEQVIAHDAHIPATEAKVIEQFEVLKQINGGLVQGIAPPISFTTAIVYGALFELGMSAGPAQILVMTSTFAMVLWLAVRGFDLLLTGWGRSACLGRKLDACLLGALYVVAPFTLIYMSYGIFWSVNIAMAIGIMPLLLHFNRLCFVEERGSFHLGSIAGLALCLTIVAWSILFLFPTLLMLAVLQATRGGRIERLDLKKWIAVGCLSLVGAAPSVYGMYLSAVDAGWREATDPVTANAAFEHIKGGVLTGFMQYAAWPIYTQWSPRLMLGFPSHFFSASYVVLTTLLLGVVSAVPIIGGHKSLKRHYVQVLAVLLVAVYFVKGAGEPFGAIFRGFISIVPGAGLVRTPDTKFGVFVIVAIATAIALALANGEGRTRWFRVLARTVVVAVALYHTIPLINGQAILALDSELAPGQTTRGYAVALTPTEHRIVNALTKESSVGVVVLPPSFGVHTRREGGVFAYRQVIGDFVVNPLYYAEWNEAPNVGVKKALQGGVEEGDWTLLPDLGVGFVLVNRTAMSERADRHAIYRSIRKVPDAWVKVVDDGEYELYRLADIHRKPLIAIWNGKKATSAKVLEKGSSFARFDTGPVEPGSFAVSFRAAENRHWRLVVIPDGCAGGMAICAVRGLMWPPAGLLVERDGISSDLVNRWRVKKESPSGVSSHSMMVVFVPQLMMLVFLTIAMGTALLCLYLVLSRKRIEMPHPLAHGVRA